MTAVEEKDNAPIQKPEMASDARATWLKVFPFIDYNAAHDIQLNIKAIFIKATTQNAALNGSVLVRITPSLLTDVTFGEVDANRILSESDLLPQNVSTDYTLFSLRSERDDKGHLKRFFLPVSAQQFTRLITEGSSGEIYGPKPGKFHGQIQMGQPSGVPSWELAKLDK